MALHLERFLVAIAVIAAGAAPAQHRVLFLRLEELTAQELLVFVGLEVREAHDDVVGVEGGPDHGDALGQFLDVVLDFIVERAGEFGDLAFGVPFLEGIELQERQRMDSDLCRDDELLSGEPDAVVREGGEPEGDLGVPDIHHDLGPHLGQLVQRDLVFPEIEHSSVDLPDITFGAADRALLFQSQSRLRTAGTHHTGDTQLTAYDRGVRGSTAALRYDGARLFHDRFPIGVGGFGDQHVARSKLVDLLRALQHANTTRSDPLAHRDPLDDHVAPLE